MIVSTNKAVPCYKKGGALDAGTTIKSTAKRKRFSNVVSKI